MEVEIILIYKKDSDAPYRYRRGENDCNRIVVRNDGSVTIGYYVKNGLKECKHYSGNIDYIITEGLK